jgi:hypothetical protein
MMRHPYVIPMSNAVRADARGGAGGGRAVVGASGHAGGRAVVGASGHAGRGGRTRGAGQG